MSVLESLRAYAAANPTDVKVIAETIQHAAELEALEALARLSRKWAKRSDAARRAQDSQVIIDYTQKVLAGFGRDHEPFPLVRRVVKVCGVRTPAPRGPQAWWPGW